MPRPKPPLAFHMQLFSFSRLSGSLEQVKIFYDKLAYNNINGNYRVSSSENVQVQVEFLGKQVHREGIRQKIFPLY